MITYIANIADAKGEVKTGAFTNLSEISRVGSYGAFLCNGNSYWYNGSTYQTGYKNDANNTAIIFQYYQGTVYYSEVGTPDFDDILNHAYPTVWLDLCFSGFWAWQTY
jgi:hypothetical protein